LIGPPFDDIADDAFDHTNTAFNVTWKNVATLRRP